MRGSVPGRTQATHRHHVRTAGVLASAALLLPLIGAGPSSGAEVPAYGQLQSAFATAAADTHVPENVLLAVSYLESRWDANHGRPSVGAGYGPMHLTDVTPAASAEHFSRWRRRPARRHLAPRVSTPRPAPRTWPQRARPAPRRCGRPRGSPAPRRVRCVPTPRRTYAAARRCWPATSVTSASRSAPTRAFRRDPTLLARHGGTTWFAGQVYDVSAHRCRTAPPTTASTSRSPPLPAYARRPR